MKMLEEWDEEGKLPMISEPDLLGGGKGSGEERTGRRKGKSRRRNSV